MLWNIVIESWLVLCQMAPYLLFGFLAAGILSVCFSPQWIERHLGRPGFGPVLKASLLGVPMPLCSCGVIPVAASMRRHGASRAATASFLLSTPQTGADNIALIYGLLGPIFAIFSPIAAFLTGLLGGGLVHFFGEQNGNEPSNENNNHACSEACCKDKESRNIVSRSLNFGFVVLPRDIGLALLVGVLIAGTISAVVPDNQWQTYLGGGIVSILILMALGVPIYVCSSASVPIAAGLIHMGASPGAAFAFLISGPATNAATITTIWKTLGRRTAILYLLTIAVSAILFGLLLDQIFSLTQMTVPQLEGHAHQHEMAATGWLSNFWAIVLLLIIVFSYFRSPHKESGLSGDEEQVDTTTKNSTASEPEEKLDRLQFSISGMTCGHCVETVRRTLRQTPGVRGVEVNLKAGRATVVGVKLDPDQLSSVINSLGYDVQMLK